MSKLSTQVQQLEQKADSLEYENEQLKAMLYRMITGDKENQIEGIDKIGFSPNFSTHLYTGSPNRMISISVVIDSEVIATKEI